MLSFRLHLKLQARVVKIVSYITGGVLKYNLAHQRYVTVLCMLFKIKSNPNNASIERCRCRMCRRVLLVVVWLLIGTRLRLHAAKSILNDLNDLDGVRLSGFKSEANAFLLA